jgi:integrase
MRRIWKSMPAGQLVFEGRVPGLPINFRTAWHKACQDAGLPDLHMHDLRHAAAADLLRSGVTLGVAAQVLGHSPQVLSRRYGHLETAALRQAQEQRWRAAA